MATKFKRSFDEEQDICKILIYHFLIKLFIGCEGEKETKLYSGEIGQHLDQVIKMNITSEGQMAITGKQYNITPMQS